MTPEQQAMKCENCESMNAVPRKLDEDDAGVSCDACWRSYFEAATEQFVAEQLAHSKRAKA